MLYSSVSNRFYCIYSVFMSGGRTSSSKNYVCKNVVFSQLGFIRCIGNPYDVSLCVQMWKPGELERKNFIYIAAPCFVSA